MSTPPSLHNHILRIQIYIHLLSSLNQIMKNIFTHLWSNQVPQWWHGHLLSRHFDPCGSKILRIEWIGPYRFNLSESRWPQGSSESDRLLRRAELDLRAVLIQSQPLEEVGISPNRVKAIGYWAIGLYVHACMHAWMCMCMWKLSYVRLEKHIVHVCMRTYIYTLQLFWFLSLWSVGSCRCKKNHQTTSKILGFS